MATYGQFCSMARAHEILGGRWTLLIVRELLCGGRRFSDIRRGIPRISRTMLSERLHALSQAGAVERVDGAQGPEYELAEAGRELAPLVGALAEWGQRWLGRSAEAEELDLEPLLVDMQRRARPEALPEIPIVARFELRSHRPRFMLLKRGEASHCANNPGFPEQLRIGGPLVALVAWWRGDLGLVEARRAGLAIEGPRALARAFPGWFERYQFAHIAPAVEARSGFRTPRPAATKA